MSAKVLLSAYYDGSGKAKVLRVYNEIDFEQADKDLEMLLELNSDKQIWLQECDFFNEKRTKILIEREHAIDNSRK